MSSVNIFILLLFLAPTINGSQEPALEASRAVVSEKTITWIQNELSKNESNPKKLATLINAYGPIPLSLPGMPIEHLERNIIGAENQWFNRTLGTAAIQLISISSGILYAAGRCSLGTLFDDSADDPCHQYKCLLTKGIVMTSATCISLFCCGYQRHAGKKSDYEDALINLAVAKDLREQRFPETTNNPEHELV